MKTTNRQTIVIMTQHRKLKNKQHEPHQKLGVILGAPKKTIFAVLSHKCNLKDLF